MLDGMAIGDVFDSLDADCRDRPLAERLTPCPGDDVEDSDACLAVVSYAAPVVVCGVAGACPNQSRVDCGIPLGPPAVDDPEVGDFAAA